MLSSHNYFHVMIKFPPNNVAEHSSNSYFIFLTTFMGRLDLGLNYTGHQRRVLECGIVFV
jgi:hypothetical protein